MFIDTEGCMIVHDFFMIQMFVGNKVFIILAHEFKDDDVHMGILREVFESMSIESQKRLYCNYLIEILSLIVLLRLRVLTTFTIKVRRIYLKGSNMLFYI